MSWDQENFFKNWATAYKKTYFDVIDELIGDPKAIDSFARDEDFLRIAFVTRAAIDASKEPTELYTEVELTKRVVYLYTLLLARLGIILKDTNQGIFEFIDAPSGFCTYAPKKLLSSIKDFDLYKQVLNNILRSFSMLGMIHYTCSLVNCFTAATFSDPNCTKNNRFIVTQQKELAEDYLTLKQVADWNPDPSEFKALTTTRPSATSFKITQINTPNGSQQIKTCQHGVLMRREKQTQTFICFLKFFAPEAKLGCNGAAE